MGSSDLGSWAPLTIRQTVDLFAAAPFRWWVGGGLALELFTGRSWREHSDIDVGLCRTDAPGLAAVLDGWEVSVAASGALSVWDGAPPAAELQQNNLWCRRDAAAPWVLDVTLGDGDANDWIFRRDPKVRVPWSDAVLTTADGVPHLAPELQLLFKSKDPRAKDDVDAHEVIPALDADRRARLAELLADQHPWRAIIGAAR